MFAIKTPVHYSKIEQNLNTPLITKNLNFTMFTVFSSEEKDYAAKAIISTSLVKNVNQYLIVSTWEHAIHLCREIWRTLPCYFTEG